MNIKKTTLMLAMILFVGCSGSSKKSDEVVSAKISSGDHQTVKTEVASKEIVVEFFGKKKPGLLGGKGKAPHVSNTPVKIILPANLSVIGGEDKMMTDSGGYVRFAVKASKIGDYYIKVQSIKSPEVSKTVHLTAGITKINYEQELHANDLSEPFGVVLTDSDNKPIAGKEVFFELVSKPGVKNKAKITKSKVVTNADGIATTTMKSDKGATGQYDIMVQTDGFRTTKFKILSINNWNLAVTVLGGLALFIFGMSQMSNGLQQVAGNKLKTILGYFTRNRFIAVITGALVTGFIQSSSASTVMVVGFVNAGLLSLQQAIGVIFGTNIGTTITAQMLSFKLNNLAMPTIILGVLGILIAKKTITKGWASVLFGFGLLFYGMTIMSSQLKGLKDFPTFIEFFKSFECDSTMAIGAVLGAIAIGTIMTVVVQSSSASTGIILALAAGGLINFYTAMPLILGTNIGTTITANLATIGASKRSKQAALAHTMFNLVGTLYMLALFYIPYKGQPIFLYFIDTMTEGNVFIGENVTRNIAMGHTMFNVLNVIILLPFINIFVILCRKLVPIKEDAVDTVQRLEPHLLNTPSLALPQAVAQISYMTKRSWAMIEDSVAMIANQDFSKEEELSNQEQDIDDMQKEVTTYLAQLAKNSTLTTSQAKALPILVHCNNNAERLGDNAEDIIDLAKRATGDHKLTEAMVAGIDDLVKKLAVKVELVTQEFTGEKVITVKDMLKDDLAIKQQIEALENSDIQNLSAGNEDIVSGVVYIEMLTILRKINSRLTNILERSIKLNKSEIIVKL